MVFEDTFIPSRDSVNMVTFICQTIQCAVQHGAQRKVRYGIDRVQERINVEVMFNSLWNSIYSMERQRVQTEYYMTQ